MPTTPEGKVKDVVDKILKKYGVWYFKPVSRGMGTHGIPDYICCIQGKFLGIECKKEGGEMTALQDRQMIGIRAAGGSVLLIMPSTLGILEGFIKGLME